MSKRRILMVDDDVNLTRTVKMALEQAAACEVRVENRPERAEQAARHFRPEIILMDVIMPGMDGGQVAFEIRQDPVLRAIPILFLTSIIEKDEADASGGDIGEEVFLAKPFTAEELLQRINDMVRT